MIGLITRDMEQNGYYEQASRIIHILMAVITSLNVVVGVRTSYLFARNRKREVRQHLYDTFRFTYLLSFPMAAGLLACAPHFVPWFFGVGYDAVTPLLQALTPLLFIIGTSNVLGTLYLTPCGQRGRSNRAIVTGAVLNFLLNLILIPFLQAYGAVIASVAAETVITLLYLYYCRRFVRLAQILGLALRCAAFCAAVKNGAKSRRRRRKSHEAGAVLLGRRNPLRIPGVGGDEAGLGRAAGAAGGAAAGLPGTRAAVFCLGRHAAGGGAPSRIHPLG